VSRSVPERVRWAIEVLDVQPSDEILEIGPGPGMALALVCDQLVDGHIIAIDRSATAVRRTTERNAECIGSGKARVVQAVLADLSFGGQCFDKIFAINVNLFWVQPDGPHFPIVANLLRPQGRLYLFYEAPAAKADQIQQSTEAALRRHGFATSTRSASDPAVRCIEAWLQRAELLAADRWTGRSNPKCYRSLGDRARLGWMCPRAEGWAMMPTTNQHDHRIRSG
jgi:SAM-dependent methyltransferase